MINNIVMFNKFNFQIALLFYNFKYINNMANKKE